MVKSWLNNRNFNLELLFRKSRDDSTPKDFHDKCDNKVITIVFFETTKGYKFGDYTELQWDNSRAKKDKSAFIFSFNHREKYNAKNNNDSIYGNLNEVPRFGCGWTEIYLDNTLNKGNSFDSPKNNTFLS